MKLNNLETYALITLVPIPVFYISWQFDMMHSGALGILLLIPRIVSIYTFIFGLMLLSETVNECFVLGYKVTKDIFGYSPKALRLTAFVIPRWEPLNNRYTDIKTTNLFGGEINLLMESEDYYKTFAEAVKRIEEERKDVIQERKHLLSREKEEKQETHIK